MSDPCKPEACAIQSCLISNGFDESKCTDLIDNLYRCCTAFYKQQGIEARSPCCPLPDLLEKKQLINKDK